MGEAKRRGDFEARKRQALARQQDREAKSKILRRDRESMGPWNQTSSTRSKASLAMAVATMLAIAATGELK